MTFNSYLFVFIFLPLTVLVYWFLRRKKGPEAALWFLIAASLVFLGSVSLSGVLIFVMSLVFNYCIASVILKTPGNQVKQHTLLIIGVVFDLFLLAFFKHLGTPLIISGFKITTPGISFYTFCEIILLTECFRGNIKELPLSRYGFLMTFFPKLLQGPILAPKDLFLQENGKDRLTSEMIWRSLFLFSMGLFKKVILADTLGKAVDFGFTNLSSLHTGEALIVMLSYTLQLYFDFSGYCDMALASAHLFGFELPLNFDSPYKAKNIIDFWKRWHITLTRFFTEYVYIPLGGSRKGEVRTYVNILIIFFLSGLWHGNGAGFLVWGMMHGVLYALTRLVVKKKKLPAGAEEEKQGIAVKIRDAVKVLLTFLYVNAAWVFFRSGNLHDALHLFSDMGQFWFPRFNYNLAKCFQIPELWYVLKVLRIDRFFWGLYVPMALMLLFSLAVVFFAKTAVSCAKNCRIRLANTLLIAVLLIWCVLSFEGVRTYLYVNF